jgi:hypothetical protein
MKWCFRTNRPLKIKGCMMKFYLSLRCYPRISLAKDDKKFQKSCMSSKTNLLRIWSIYCMQGYKPIDVD